MMTALASLLHRFLSPPRPSSWISFCAPPHRSLACKTHGEVYRTGPPVPKGSKASSADDKPLSVCVATEASGKQVTGKKSAHVGGTCIVGSTNYDSFECCCKAA